MTVVAADVVAAAPLWNVLGLVGPTFERADTADGQAEQAAGLRRQHLASEEKHE